MFVLGFLSFQARYGFGVTVEGLCFGQEHILYPPLAGCVTEAILVLILFKHRREIIPSHCFPTDAPRLGSLCGAWQRDWHFCHGSRGMMRTGSIPPTCFKP